MAPVSRFSKNQRKNRRIHHPPCGPPLRLGNREKPQRSRGFWSTNSLGGGGVQSFALTFTETACAVTRFGQMLSRIVTALSSYVISEGGGPQRATKQSVRSGGQKYLSLTY